MDISLKFKAFHIKFLGVSGDFLVIAVNGKPKVNQGIFFIFQDKCNHTIDLDMFHNFLDNGTIKVVPNISCIFPDKRGRL